MGNGCAKNHKSATIAVAMVLYIIFKQGENYGAKRRNSSKIAFGL